MTADTWVWDGSGWVQQHPATTPPARVGAQMAYDAASGQLLLFGGLNGVPLNDTWTWTGSNWVQLHPATSPQPTTSAAMAYDPATRQVVFFGGQQFVDNALVTQPSMWSWNGSNWTQLSPATTPGD